MKIFLIQPITLILSLKKLNQKCKKLCFIILLKLNYFIIKYNFNLEIKFLKLINKKLLQNIIKK